MEVTENGKTSTSIQELDLNEESIHGQLDAVFSILESDDPYFSTDTCAALRASEINADILLKATKVDGIYDKDPSKHDDAVKYEQLEYIDALRDRLNVMDSTAFSLCMENHMPILVFSMREAGSILRAVMGEKIGTLVT